MSATATTYSTTTRHTLSRRRGPGLGGITTASTPNLNQLYSAQATRLVPPSLARKGSFAALTQNSLAAIPDDTESYANDILTSDTSKMPADDPVTIGDVVDVPGGMLGTVRFVGSVQGRKGTFAGVELHREHAARGKNSGDVDGISYFTTTKPGAGIFLPLSKALRHSPGPVTPTATTPAGLKVANQNSTNFTPPTPSIPKFSQSVGPGRAASPTGRKPPRTSLPRPDSPVRRLQLTPAPRQSIATPGPKGPGPRFGSPNANNRFAQSVRGTAGDPSKRLPTRDRKGSIGPRSASALGNPTATGFTDDETTPVGPNRTKPVTNGSVGSVSSFGLKMRPGSRAQSRAGSRAGNHANEEELEKLRAQLEDRDRQLRDQASTLSEMESSLTELQGLIENSDGPPGGMLRRGSVEDKDAAQLRALLREKNDKIAMLTAEFDAHRADFRSTIDTLEMASTETERVYEKRIEELMQENQELSERSVDVDTVASQLKQLEELVQELEEGLEDARRGEAEARGEVEFLRGEVERTRSELRREREKAQAAIGGVNGAANGDQPSISKELEQKEDEIRGLKAIIHSLSRDSVPGDASDKSPGSARNKHESIEERLAREKLEREVAELRAVIENKNHREEELEREVENLRRQSATLGSKGGERSSMRDSRGTVVLSPRASDLQKPAPSLSHHTRMLESMPESDSYSTATENSTLWCEICETGGHDILTCSNMFGTDGAATAAPPPAKTGRDVVRQGLKNLTVPGANDDIKPAPLSPIKTKAPTSVPDTVRILPNPMESGPVAGKESGVVDAAKWCALCERDGHDSVDCPFEDAF